MLATLIYTLITDGSPFRSELFTPWLTATLIDFYVNVVAIAVWVAYNESSWVNTILWIILLICFGSITTCVYIVRKLVNVSTRGPEDPVRLILSRWMAATLIDFYINVLAISVWVAHKESTWVGTVIWICLLICFGSITTCTYIAIQLFRLSDGDPMYYILLDHHSKPAVSSSSS
ncbi:uncharacterized protein LOC109827697 isoform X3 [Asparagus officinalis]|uniref:uncharacterized protein LOC109827697 isoform X3 n=1 Tax=Asparagus officinalis TaxID=4686 RepID=UPI00098E1C78|nr:uncharacterized protein LOC109827697 isoform X3 [Asparagus officinalis]